MIKNIIFDLGGVLLHWNPKEFPQEFQRFIASKNWDQLHCGHISQAEAIATLSDSFDKAFISDFIPTVYPVLTFIPEGIELLNRVRAREYTTYILSNFHEQFFAHLPIDTAFFDTFDGVVLSFREGCKKPEPKIYQLLLSRYNLNPNECVFIDDMSANVAGAQAFGMDGIVCTDHATVCNTLIKRKIL